MPAWAEQQWAPSWASASSNKLHELPRKPASGYVEGKLGASGADLSLPVGQVLRVYRRLSLPLPVR